MTEYNEYWQDDEHGSDLWTDFYDQEPPPPPSWREKATHWFWKTADIVKTVSPFIVVTWGLLAQSIVLMLFAVFLIVAVKAWFRPVTITGCTISNSDPGIVVN